MEEKLRMQLISSSIEYEEEEFYEEIEAPKFVDFTIPNHFSPDDRFWFCARVGCDLKHEEEMDPEAIDKNFVFRVMVARSPNVRFRRAISRKPLSESKKCPFSAPPKPAKSRLPRLALVSTSITKKLLNEENGKLRTPNAKVKPTSTPKARVKHVAAKYMTSPRKKKESSPNPNAFRSARNPTKMRVSLPKSKVIGKALVFNSPKKGLKNKKSEELCTPITKLCEGVKKLQIHSHRKGISQKSFKDYRSKSKKLPLVNDVEIHRPFSRAKDNDDEENKISALHIVTKVSEEDNFKKIQEPNVDEKGKEKDNVTASDIESQDSRVISGSDENEDKENGLNFADIRTLNNENLNKHNASVKPKVQSKQTTQKLDKTTKENCPVGSGKQVLKNRKLKTTNPKPFRLRTDERGVLREATMVRQVNSTENLSTASENAQGTGNGVTDKASKKDEIRKDQPRIIKSRYKTSKEVEPKSEKSSRNTKLLFLQNQRVITSNVKIEKLCANRGTEIDMLRPKEAKELGKEANDLKNNVLVAQKSATQGKWTGTIPREPKFHSLHKPKSCKKDKP